MVRATPIGAFLFAPGENTMNKFIAAAKNNRAAALAENSGSGSRMAGPGRFKVKLVGAEIGENRQGTAKRAKLSYEVVAVIKGDEKDVGATISEYISENHNSDSQSKRYTALVNQLLDAGVKEDKISDEDDETLWDAIVTAVQAAGKVINKGVKVFAALDHVQTTKLAENGKPYFNNYFVELSAETESAKPAMTEKPNPKAMKEKPNVQEPILEDGYTASPSYDDSLPFN